MAQKIDNYKDFYSFYLTEHKDYTCRILHFTGTALVFTLLLYALFSEEYYLLWFVPVVGYGFARVGHAFSEKQAGNIYLPFMEPDFRFQTLL